MTFYKKFLIILIFFITFGLIIYQLQRQKTVSSNAKPIKENIISKNEPKNECEEQLKKQTENYIVENFVGTPEKVDFTSFPDAKLYYTIITNAEASGPNFAGHFTLASWGCGTDCFGYAIINSKTGRIITYSEGNPEYNLQEFSLDSRIFLLKPVNAGQDRKYYKIIEYPDNKDKVELACSEKAKEDMYGPPE